MTCLAQDGIRIRIWFLDLEEEARVKTQVQADLAWFEIVKSRRIVGAKPG